MVTSPAFPDPVLLRWCLLWGVRSFTIFSYWENWKVTCTWALPLWKLQEPLAFPCCAGTGGKQGTQVFPWQGITWPGAGHWEHRVTLESWEHCQMPIEPWGTIPVVLGQRQTKTILVGKMQQCAGHPGWLCMAIPALTADCKSGRSFCLDVSVPRSNLILENSAPIQFPFPSHQQRQDGQWRERLSIPNIWGEGQKLLLYNCSKMYWVILRARLSFCKHWCKLRITNFSALSRIDTESRISLCGCRSNIPVIYETSMWSLLPFIIVLKDFEAATNI